ncbi:crispr-associated cas3 family [Leptolyngbya sp. Heron Island J]|uniref:type I-D CRISPR-associated helicase Cas3' n=1 Tax=Leptolyngbya sp. Heron Island J TaxID=1385935 RepID=UPI0003B93F84|nr:type I-D CRISPR-associated helicase Cas3' [Leptolyngbya sp. Heron Island J]ESA33846.1 crispr-associated cas3 family [Leptolyngbya sp. Heron Island J]
MASIQLKPVYSCPAENIPASMNLPATWRLAWHQVETLNALHSSDVDVVFNTAMTGDGKSLAAYLDILQGNSCAIGLYPTNALARDQEIQIQDYIAKFQPSNEPRVNRLSGPELEIYAENEGLRKGSAIATRSGQSEVLITNPDIFHYLHRGAYLTDKETPDKLWNRIDKDFDLFIFDEFHVFAAPQVASVLNTMLLIRVTNRHKKFLFLSATPNEALLKRLDAAGFKYCVINPSDADKYKFPDTQAEETELKAKHWRQVARPIDLAFVAMEPTSKASETWLRENQGSILEQFLKHPGSKGAIILNSIAAVKRLTPIFRELFVDHGLTVRENTGLSGQQEKTESLAADLVIGTSTIDVGVDFKINFLVFESSDAGNFIQRLGRLGRHDGYTKDGQDIRFDGFRAYALVPNFFVERLFAGEDAVLADGGTCDRIRFQNLIREKYRKINNFEGYYKRWGGVQSFYLAQQLKNTNIQQQYAGSLQKFCASCEKTFDIQLKRVAGQLSGWAKDWQTLSGQKSGNPIAEDARSFRGSSPLQCGLYDLTEAYEPDRFKTYDLPGVLSNLDIEMRSKSAFLDTLKESAERTGQPIPKGRFRHCLGFMKLCSYREERLNWTFTYPGDLQPIADAWQVQVLQGLQVWQPDNPWVGSINRRLKQQALVCYVLRKPMREVRLRLRLPMHFQIYPISDAGSIHDANAPYSVAFGQSALLLDTLAYRFKHDRGEIWVV